MSLLKVTGNDLLSFAQQVKSKLDTKQKNLIAGTGIEILANGTINVTLDTTVTVVLTTLPEANATTYEQYKSKIVLVPDSQSLEQNNNYIEYAISKTTSGDVTTYFWEKLGERHLDLSNYYNKQEVDSALALKADKSDYYKVKATALMGNDLLNVSGDTTPTGLEFAIADLAGLVGIINANNTTYSITTSSFITAWNDIISKLNGSNKSVAVKFKYTDSNSNIRMGVLNFMAKDSSEQRITFMSVGGGVYTSNNESTDLSLLNGATFDVAVETSLGTVSFRVLNAPNASITATELSSIINALG